MGDTNLKPSKFEFPTFNGAMLLHAHGLQEVYKADMGLKALYRGYHALYSAPQDKPQSLGFEAREGKFHIKAALMPSSRKYLAAKLNGNFPGNLKFGLPTIQGVVLLSDATNGRLLAIIDSAVLTAMRTAAATALAAQFGARKSAAHMAVIGCGMQAAYQIQALLDIFSITHVACYDSDMGRAESLAKAMSKQFPGTEFASGNIGEATIDADIIVTCTTAQKPVLMADMVKPGCFIAAVGADNPDKQEIDPMLFKSARILVDDLDQCATSGDLSHALKAGLLVKSQVWANLAELAAGVKLGRLHEHEIVIFDSTGTGLQDVAVAAACFEEIVKDMSN